MVKKKKTLLECILHVQGLHYTTHKDWGDEETQLCEQYECWSTREVDDKIEEDAKCMLEFINN